MKQSLTITSTLTGLALIALALYFWSFSVTQYAHATVNESVSKMTNGGTLCGNASSTLMMASSTTGRNLAYISNDSPLSIELSFGRDAASSTGYLLAASSTLRMDSVGSFSGSIYCYGIGGAASTTWADSQN